MFVRIVLWALVLFSGLMSCKAKVDPREVTFYHRHDGAGVDPEVSSYIDDRTKPFLPKYLNIVVLDAIGTTSTLALARREPDSSYCEIEIDQQSWSSLSDLRKQTLLYHELGHCLGIEHAERGEKVESIMYHRLLLEPELRLLASNVPANADWMTAHFLELFRDKILESTRLYCSLDASC